MLQNISVSNEYCSFEHSIVSENKLNVKCIKIENIYFKIVIIFYNISFYFVVFLIKYMQPW